MLASDEQGNPHFYIKPNDVARIFLTEDSCFFNLNMGTTFLLPRTEVKQIVIEGSEQVQYSPPSHGDKVQQYIQKHE